MKKLFLVLFLYPIITYSQYNSWHDSLAITNVKSDFAHLIQKEIEDSFYLDMSQLVEGKLEFPWYEFDGITPSFDPNPPTYYKDKKTSFFEGTLNYDEILKRITFADSYGDFLYRFSYRNVSSPYVYIFNYRVISYENGTPLNNDDYEFFKEVYLNGILIREEIENTIYTYDTLGNIEEKAYYKNGNIAELFNNDEVFELKLNSGKILKNRKTTETFYDKNGNIETVFEFTQADNYVFYEACKCCPTLENYYSISKRRKLADIFFEWSHSDCAESLYQPYLPIINNKIERFDPNGKLIYKGVGIKKAANNIDQLNEISYYKDEIASRGYLWYGAEKSDFPNYYNINFEVNYDTLQYYDPHQNQKKTYSVSSWWISSFSYEPIGVIDSLSEIYFVNAKSGLNVRDNNSLDGNKIGGLPYGSLVYIAKENQGELIVNDTDPETGEKKQIKGNWVVVGSMNFKLSFFNKDIIGGYAFDGFLTKVKTDSFDHFQFLETENRVHYSELEEGEVYLYKGEKYTGLAISFHDNGQLAFAASYKDGKLNGWWRKWEENGSLFLETEYVDGEMVSEMDFN